MNGFKKLVHVRRFLAGFLAVVMVVTMVPVSTVSATEAAGISDVLSEADGVWGGTDPASDITIISDDAPTEAAGENSAAEGGSGDSTDKMEEEPPNIGDGGTVSEETGRDFAAAEDGSGEDNNTSSDLGDAAAATGEAVPEIIEIGNKSKSEEYTGNSAFTDSLNDYVQVRVGDSVLSASEAEGTWYTYTWQKAGDTQAAAVTPTYAGKYTLVLTASDAAKAAGAKDGKIEGFEITPAKLTLRIEPIVVPPGSSQEAVEGILSEDISFEIADASNSSALSGAMGRLEPFIQLNIVKGSLKNMIDGSPVSFPLKKSDEYVVDVNASFLPGTTDEDKALTGSYTLGSEPLKVNVRTEPLIGTEVTITRKDVDGSEWYEKTNDNGEKEWALSLKTYDGQAAPEKLFDQWFTVKVQEAGTDPAVEVKLDENNAVTGEWVGYVNEIWLDTEGVEHADWKWKALDTPPTDAGEYTYRITYSSTEGVYDQSELYIDVDIRQAEVAIVPVKKGTIKEYMTAEEVLTQFDYEVYDVAKGTRGGKRTDIDRDHFWGTSYDDTGATQPYTPVLYLEAAPKGTEEWKKCGDSDRLIMRDNDYRVVFSGYKAVYNADGSFSYQADGTPAHMVDINETDSNYVVNKELSEPALLKEVVSGTLVTVETDLITGGSVTIEEAGEKAKVYDPGSALFRQREEYKRAYLKNKEGTKVSDVAGTDPSFQYTWYVARYPSDGSVPDDGYTEGYVDLTDLDIWKANRGQNDTTAFEDCVRWVRVTDESPDMLIYRAGIYKLEVAYDNAEGKYYAEENIKNVYFVIRQREIRVTLEKPSDPIKVMSETTVGDFLDSTWAERNSIRKHVYNVTDLEDPTAVSDDRELEKWIEGEDYSIEWKVVRYVPSETDPSQTVEQELGREDTFEAGGSYSLKIKDVNFLNNQDCSSYRSDARNNTAYRFSAVTSSDGTGAQTVRNAEFLSKDQSVEIGVDKMGETLITITADPTKLPDKTKKYDGRVFHIDGDEGNIGRFEKAFSDALANGLITITTTDGTDVTKEFDLETDLTYTYYTADGERLYDYEAVNVGRYILKAGYRGDTEKYHACGPVDIAEVEIKTRELTLDASNALDSVAAGTSAQTVNSRILYDNLDVSGYAPSDSSAFEYGYAWPNSGNRILIVYEKEARYTGRLTCAGNYYLEYTGQLNYPYSINYTVKYDPRQPVNVVRGHSTVTYVSDPVEDTEFRKIDGWKAAAPDTQEQGWEYTLNIMEHIPYVYRYTHDGIKEVLEGNLVKTEIRVPEEYNRNGVYAIPDTAVYQSQIEKAGGYVLSAEDGAIEALFDATEGKKAEFSISWEPGYTEKYILDFEDAKKRGLLLENLADAVAPKSLAFNAPDKKMVVGQMQQLDVKMKKVQMDDLVCLEYGLSADSPEDVLSVDKETGMVTALKPGSATVEVYPIHLVKGVKTRMTGKTVSAKVKIAVTDVDAPKITKVKALDTSVRISYKAPEEGFRREIYVLELETGKENAKNVEAMFREKIRAMSNEKWQGIFAAEPQYYDSEEEQRIGKNLGYTTVDALKANTPYAVYVRNVSGIRTLDDGSKVVRSEKGSVAIFRTTKMQLKSLKKSLSVTGAVYGSPTHNVCDAVYTPRIGFGKTDRDSDYLVVDESRREAYYEAKLFDKDVYIFTEGEFGEMAEGAEESDTAWHILPLTKEQLNSYAAPNLSYTVYDSKWKKTDLVSVDKNGKVKMKGVGKFYIRVKDENTCTCPGNSSACNKCAYLCLKVTADITSIAPKKKKVQLQVGEEVKLGDLLSYKSGSKVINGYTDYAVYADDLKEELEENGFILSDDGTKITAAREGTVQITLTDNNIVGSQALFTISSVLSPVKSLKAPEVIDDRMKIVFQSNAYTYGEPADGLGYRIEILDGRNKTRRSKIVDHFAAAVDYNEKTKRYTCEYMITGLTQQSQYTINVYTVFEKETSKKWAKVKAKTTKMAASYYYLDEDMECGGLPIYVSEYAKELAESPYDSFTSGNAYTLTVEPGIYDRNRSKMTDTLVWKSTNTKVATVKAGKGSFSASLKAVKPGYTMIEARSKIWKNKVVARYGIQVCAVGDAYKMTNRYYEENEPSDPNDSEDPYDQETITLPLSAGEKRKVSVDRVERFEFKVPETGKYSFHAYGDHVSVDGVITGNGESWEVYGENERAAMDLGWLKTGDVYTLTFKKAYVSDKTTTAYFISVELDQNINPVTDGTLEMTDQTRYREYFSYEAAADGYYRFHAPDADGNDCRITLYRTETDMADGSGFVLRDNGWYSMNAGDTIYGEVVTNRSAVTLSVTKNKDLQADGAVDISCIGGEYIGFTAAEDGYYQFCSENAESVTTAQAGGIVSTRDADGKNFYLNCELKQGDSGYLKVTADSLGTPALSVSMKKVDAELVFSEGAQDNTVNLKFAPGREKDQYVAFTAPQNGYFHFYTTSTATPDMIQIEAPGLGETGSGTAGVKLDMKAGDRVYLRVSSGAAEAAEAVLHVANVTPEEIGATGTPADIEIPAGDSVIRTFTAAEAGCYEFALSSENVDYLELYTNIQNAEAGDRGNAVSYVWGRVDNSGSAGTSYSSIIRYMMKAGETVYLRVPDDDTSARTVKLAASKTDAADQIITEASDTLAAEAEGWRYFTADRSGMYTFTAAIDNGAGGSAEASLHSAYINNVSYDSKGSLKSFGSLGTTLNSVTYSLDAGQSVWLYVKNASSDAEVTVRTGVELDENSEYTVLYANKETETVTLTSDVPIKWARFTADRSGVYDFRFSPGGKNINGSLCREYNGSYIYNYLKNLSNDFVFSYKMDVGQSVWIKTQAQDSSILNGSSAADIGLNVSLKPRQTVLEGSQWNGTLMPGESEWVSFTAMQTGLYRFGFETEGGNISRSLVRDYGSTSSSGSISSYGMKSGESVWLYMNNRGSEEISVDLSAEFTEDISLGLDSNKTFLLEPYSDKQLCFTADRSGTYIFKAVAAQDGSLYGYLNKSYNAGTISNTNKSGSSFEIVNWMNAGDSRWLYVQEQNGEETEVTLSVSWKEPVELSAGEKTYSVSRYVPNWACFTASEEGLYSFDVLPAVYTRIGFCEAEGDTEYVVSDQGTSAQTHWIRSYYLKAGQSVWLYTYTTYADEEVTVTITKEEIDLSVGENGSRTSALAYGGYMWARFTAEEGGIYGFKYVANSSIRGYLCDTFIPGTTITALPYGTESTGEYSVYNNNFEYYRTLTARETVWMCVYNTYSNNNVTLSVTRKDWNKSVSAGSSEDLTLSAYEAGMVKFTAETEGTYTFTFSKKATNTNSFKGGLLTDPHVYYSRDNNIAYAVDQSGVSQSFTSLANEQKFTYELTQGQEIWLCVQNNSNSGSQVVTLSVAAQEAGQ